MGDVIQFPTPNNRDWQLLLVEIQNQMTAARMSDAAQRRVLERMEAFYKLIDLQFTFSFPNGTPPEIHTQLDDLVTKIKNQASSLLMDRLVLECQYADDLGL